MRYIITDVDGCLAPEESIPWNLDQFFEFARLAREANENKNGIAPLTLCTGRPQPYVELLMKLFHVTLPAVCESGAVLYTLADNASRFGPGVNQEKLRALRALRDFIETEILPQNPGCALQFGKEAQLSIYSPSLATLRAIAPRVAAFAAQHGPEVLINDSHVYLNISLQGVDKGAGIRQVLAGLACPRGQAAGIGDTEGDLPLREAVGWFACPANARDSIKAVADYISPYPTILGMLDILRRPELRLG